MSSVRVPSWLTFFGQLQCSYCNALYIGKYTFLKMKRKAEEERGLIRAPVFLVFVLCLLRQSGNGVFQQSVGTGGSEALLSLCRTSGAAWLLKLPYSCFSTCGFLNWEQKEGGTENFCLSLFPSFKLWKFVVRWVKLVVTPADQVVCCCCSVWRMICRGLSVYVGVGKLCDNFRRKLLWRVNLTL